MHRLPRLAAVLLLLFLAARPAAAGEVRVVASIKPLHSLVAGVLAGVATPELLLAGGESPHSYALRPSQARAVAGADLFFWIGPELEGFLVKPLKALSARGRVVTVMTAPGLTLYPVRRGGVWGGHDHAHGHDHEHGQAPGPDPHLWLDPQNARGIVRLALRELTPLFPGREAQLAANAAALEARLDALDRRLGEQLAPVSRRPFIVFHDAYQYLEARYRLNAAGALTLNPEQAPGARRLREIRQAIAGRGAVCVFAEPQFEPRLVATVVEGTNARLGVLDPEGGAELAPGAEAYFELLRRLGDSLSGCLGEK